MTIDIKMRTTRMDCIQIQVGDMPASSRHRRDDGPCHVRGVR
jgi:hypothetical protein